MSLYEFAMRWGVDGDGLAFDAVDPAGSVLEGTKLLWPQTEQLKAHAAMYEWTGDERARRGRRALSRLCRALPRGGGRSLRQQAGRDGRPIAAPTPARVFYHLYVALAEADRREA